MEITIYLLLLILIAAVELLRRRPVLFDALFFFNAYYALVYGIIPLIISMYPSSIAPFPIAFFNMQYLHITPWLILLSYVVFLAGWCAGLKFRLLGPSSRFNISSRTIRKFCIVGLVISALSLYLYALSFGGIFEAWTMGALYRYSSGFQERFDIGVTVVFEHFVVASKIICYYCFFKLFLQRTRTHRRFYAVLMICSLVVIFAYFPIKSGRGAVIWFFLGLYFLTAIYRRRVYLTKILPLSLLSLLFLMYGKQFFSAFRYLLTGDLSDFSALFSSVSATRLQNYNLFYNTIIKEGIHAVVSLEQAWLRAGQDLPYLFFRDYVYVWPSLIPSRLIGWMFELPPTISTINTEILIGKAIASTPPGLLGSFVYSMGGAGLFLGMFLYGFCGKLLQNTLISWYRSFPGSVVYFYFLSVAFGWYVINGDPKVYIFSNFTLILSITLIFVYQKMPKFRYFRPNS